MPRIDPLELLDCLDVLLTPEGGIKCEEEVSRMSSLMERFSKKLVSKTIYVLILKSTKTNLLDCFMENGGWHLIHSWLVHGLEEKNWPLLKEILEVLVICPVNVDRLKSNSLPRHIKYLSKAAVIPDDIRELAATIVRDWLIVVKAATQSEESNYKRLDPTQEESADDIDSKCVSESDSQKNEDIIQSKARTIKNLKKTGNSRIRSDRGNEITFQLGKMHDNESSRKTNEDISDDSSSNEMALISKKKQRSTRSANIKYEESDDSDGCSPRRSSKNYDRSKIALKTYSKLEHKRMQESGRSIPIKGNHAFLKEPMDKSSKSVMLSLKRKPSLQDTDEKVKDSLIGKKRNEKATDRPFKSSISKENLKNYEIEKILSKNEKLPLVEKKQKIASLKDRSSEMPKTKVEDKNVLKKGILQSEENKSKLKVEEKSKIKKIAQALKDSNEEMKSKNEDKLSVKKTEPISKKPISISVEKRFTNSDNKPKTVKTFNSKFRLTGLEDPIAVPKPPVKKISPVSLVEKKKPKENVVVETKPKSPPPSSPNIETDNDKDNSIIKLLPPATKPKTKYRDSGVFMESMISALEAPKEQPRRRKKVSKEDSTEEQSEKSTDQFINVPPKLRFYKDTMESCSSEDDIDKNKDEDDKTDDKSNCIDDIASGNAEISDTLEKNKGILKTIGIINKKTSKKTVQWKTDKDLEAIQYFEVDVSERTNVSRNFWDMQVKERSNEREALLKARRRDYECAASWLTLIPIDLEPSATIPGSNSTEKENQSHREKLIPEAIYIDKESIPDSAMEPDIQMFTFQEPPIIPSEDITASADSVNDFGDCKWPEPKLNNPELDIVPPTSAVVAMNTPNMHSTSVNFPPNSGVASLPYNTPGIPNVSIPPNWNAGPPSNMVQGNQIPQVPTIPPPMMPMCTTVPPNIPPYMIASNPSNQFPSASPYINTNMYMPNMPLPTMNAMDPQIQSWPPLPNMPDNQTPNSNEWIAQQNTAWPPPAVENTVNICPPESTQQSYSNRPPWKSDQTNMRSNTFKNKSDRGNRGGFSDRGNFRGGYNNRGGFADRGNRGEIILGERFHSKDPQWKLYNSDEKRGGPSGNWRGASNTRLCRNYKQNGFCAVSGCRFFHPRK